MIRGVNGCGAKGSWIRPPYRMFFEASCNKHDMGYNKGGDAVDRMNCDANFLRYMLVDTLRINNKWRRVYYQCWAVVFFVAVRIGGKKYFKYK